MTPTRFFLIRHAIVEPSARLVLYGDMDVSICALALAQDSAAYRWLAQRLPAGARWFHTPLSRTRATAEAIFAAGYAAPVMSVEPRFAEQHLGQWQGITHEALLAVLCDRLRGFQAGPYACKANACALTHLEEAQHWLQQRTIERMRRGVEGTHTV